MKFHESNLNDINHSKIGIKPLVSIIIATYRRDSSLERALLSLINQTYELIEIIVVDDNADRFWNQKVEKIIDNIDIQSKKEIIYIKNEVNKGSAETRNVGINVASGEFITFLDDDDVYLPRKIEKQVMHMIEKNSDFSITNLKLYDDSGKLVEKRDRKYIKKFDKDSLLKYHLLYHITGTDVMMFKKEYLLNIGGFSPIDVGDEFYLMQKAIEFGGYLSYLDKCDVKAYVHTKTEGLSIGESKINGENELFKYKKSYFHKLTIGERMFVRFRHYAVLAFAKYREPNMIEAILYLIIAFTSSPYHFLFESLKLIKNKVRIDEND